MKIAVFLDVDRTLTRDYIQQEYARALECEPEHLEVETRLQSQEITSTEFGERIIKLFASRGFTEVQAREHSKEVALQPWTDELLRLPGIHKYLVSSGPNYYIDPLAEKYRIPEEHVLRSVYSFDKKTEIIEKCKAVDEEEKEEFVKQRVKRYDITVGVGDNPELDGPFISHCTIRLMTVKTDRYIYVPNFKTVVRLITKLSEVERADGEVASIEAEKLTIPELLRAMRRLTIKSWIFVAGLFGAIFAAGAASTKLPAVISQLLKSK